MQSIGSLAAFKGLRIQNLERDVAFVSYVAREIDRGHAARADLAIDRVAAGECGVQLDECVHGDASRGEKSAA